MWHRAFYYYSGSSLAVPAQIVDASKTAAAVVSATATAVAEAVVLNATEAVNVV